MVKRLSERFRVGDAVEVYLRTVDGERWTAGTVEGFSFPGVWVRTEDGGRWFVTNSRRIRRREGSKRG